MAENQFLFLASPEEGEFGFWSLSHMSSARLVEGRLEIRMSNGDTVNLTGSGNAEFFRFLLRHSILTNGTMPSEVLEAFENRLTEDEKLKTMTFGG